MDVDMKTAVIVGNNIRTLRKIRKVSQSKLAKQIDTTQRSISRWENGRQLCNLTFLIKMCNAYQVDLNFFYPTERE